MTASATWGVTPATAGTGLTPQERARQVDRLFGVDVWFDVRSTLANYEVTRSGDWKEVRGREALRQSLLRRTLTSPGEWAALGNDYGVGARDFVKAKNTQSNRDLLATRIREQYLRDPRVSKVETIGVELGNGFVKLNTIVIPKGEALKAKPLGVSLEVK